MLVTVLAIFPLFCDGAFNLLSPFQRLRRALDEVQSVDSVSEDRKDDEAKVISIPLTKQLIPVRHNGAVVSHKSAYFGTVQLGAPKPQEFSVVFDTGSGHVIVPSVACESAACLVHRRYDTKASASAIDIDVDGTPVQDGESRDQVTVGFGTGEVTGEFATETVCIGTAGQNGPGDDARCVKSMKVVMAVEMSDEPFKSFSFDGVVGLGLSALALDPSFSFLGMLGSQGRIGKSHVGIFLADSDTDPSEISFGGHNPARLQAGETLRWSPVLKPELGYWQINIKGIRVGGKAVDFCAAGDCTAIVDTGTSHFGVPIPMISDMQEALSTRHPGNDTVDCRDANGPEVTIELEGFSLNLRTKDYARRLPFLNNNALPGSADARVCRPRLMRVGLPAPLGPKMFILGEPVLRRYYTVFNYGEKKVGFGLANQDPPDMVVMFQMTARVKIGRRPATLKAKLMVQMF